jgi:hypothetical protein
LRTHCQRFHPLELAALDKAISEGKSVHVVMKTLLNAAGKVGGPMDAFVRRVSISRGRCIKELALVIWAVENHIPFNAFSSLSWTAFLHQSGLELSAKSTLVKLLDPLYSYALKDGELQIQQCPSFATSFDIWTSLAGHKYLGITYHGISPGNFSLISRVLDLIPIDCSAYAEVWTSPVPKLSSLTQSDGRLLPKLLRRE